jgi:hypothetical protein
MNKYLLAILVLVLTLVGQNHPLAQGPFYPLIVNGSTHLNTDYNGGYWRFFCRNTGAGYFEVSRSEAAYASVRID